jgi:hypothetical protein
VDCRNFFLNLNKVFGSKIKGFKYFQTGFELRSNMEKIQINFLNTFQI